MKRHQNGEFKRIGDRYILQHYPVALAQSSPKSSLQFIPTILTAIGVLGTFYGIQAGLKDISPQMADSQALLSASQTLFSGMRTAFSTSLMGLGASSLFTILLAGCEIGRRRCHNKIRSRFDSVTILETPAQIFSRFDFEANRRAADSLAEAAVQMAKLDPNSLGQVIGECVGVSLERVMSDRLTPVFEEISGRMAKLDSDSLGQVVGKHVGVSLEHVLNKRLTPVFENISERMARLDPNSLGQVIEERVSKSLEQIMGDRLTPVFEEISGRMAKLDSDLLGQVIGNHVGASLEHIISDRLSPVFEEINGSLRSLRAIQEAQKETLENLPQSLRTDLLEPIAQRLDQSATLTDRLSKVVYALHEDISGVSQNLANSVITIQTFQKETLGELQLFAQQLQETLQEFRTETKEVLSETAQGIKQGTLEILDRAQISFEQQSQTLQTVGTEASGMMNTAKLHLVESLQRVDEMLQSSSHQVNNSMTSIKETAEAVSKLAMSDNLSWGARVHEIEEATRGIGRELQQSQKTNREMQESYQSTLSSWNSHLDQSFKRFSETQDNFFKGADQAMATVCTKFLETVNVLVEIEKYRHN